MRGHGRTGMLLSVLTCLCMMLLGGCGSVALPEEILQPSLAISESGEVTAWIVEDFTQNYYRLEELEGMVREEIADFNMRYQQKGYTASVEKVAMTAEGKKAMVELLFDTTEAYEAYSGSVLFYGTVQEAVLAGFHLDKQFVEAGKDVKAAQEEILQRRDGHILITNDKACIYGTQRPKYLSENAILNEDGSVCASSSDEYIYIIMK